MFLLFNLIFYRNGTKEKFEKPRWVELVDSLPEATRQTVGNLCASTIQNLAVLALISADLFDSVIDSVK